MQIIGNALHSIPSITKKIKAKKQASKIDRQTGRQTDIKSIYDILLCNIGTREMEERKMNKFLKSLLYRATVRNKLIG